LLNEANIATHFIKQVSDTVLLVQHCEMLPIEHVQRRLATGSYLKRHPETSEGTRFDPVLIETFLKDDARHDPQIWSQDIIRLGIASQQEIVWMVNEGRRVFDVLEQAWARLDITLVDLKIEFGHDTQGQLLVADV